MFPSKKQSFQDSIEVSNLRMRFPSGFVFPTLYSYFRGHFVSNFCFQLTRISFFENHWNIVENFRWEKIDTSIDMIWNKTGRFLDIMDDFFCFIIDSKTSIVQTLFRFDLGVKNYAGVQLLIRWVTWSICIPTQFWSTQFIFEINDHVTQTHFWSAFKLIENSILIQFEVLKMDQR